MKRHVLMVLTLAGSFLFYTGCSSKEGYKTITGVAMGHSFKIVYKVPPYAPTTFSSDIKRALNKHIQEIDKSISLYYKSSILNQINSNLSVETDSIFSTVFLKAKEVAAHTGAALNITSRPLQELWGYNLINYETVTEEEIQNVLPYIGFHKIHLKDGIISKEHPHIHINFNTLGVGLSADHFADMLRSYHVTNFMIEIGEVVVCQGVNPSEAPWRIQLKQAADNVLYLKDKSISAHGSPLNLNVKGKKVYNHLFDTKTGYPAEDPLISVVVISESSLMVSAYSLAFFSMGLDKSIQFLESHSNLQAILFYYKDDRLEIFTTSNITPRHETLYFP